MKRRDKNDTEDHTDRSLFSRIIEGVIVFIVLGFAIKLGVEAILSVRIPLLIISIICIAIVVGYRVYRYKRDHDDY